MKNRFEGKSVLVTGGNSGIGLAAAQAFVNEGARVLITGRDQKTLDTAKATLGPNSLAIRNDASSVAGAQELAQAVAAQGWKLDALFLNAGIAKIAPIEATTEAIWDQTFAVNVKGPFFTIQALLPHLNRGASIVLNGSINAHIGMPGTVAYAASKAAMISMAKTLTGELLDRGIRVNVVSAGPVKTPLYGRLGVPADQLDKVAQSILAQVPLKRFATAEEIASTVTYLASDDSAFIIATEIIADGGMGQL